MNNQLVICGALANAGIENGEKLFIEFLKENIEDITIYRDTGPGIKNALDWHIVLDTLSTVSSVVRIAGALWTAYEKFIVPLKNENAFVFISIQKDRYNHVQFLIGKEYKDKQVFIETFTKEVESLNNDTNITTTVREQTTRIEIK